MDGAGQVPTESFQRSHEGFWSTVKAPKRARQKAEKICDESGQVIRDEERIMELWKEYFVGLLLGSSQQ